MRKVFAFDLDGTLLKKNNTIDPLTQQALTLSAQNNNLNVIATGRGILKVKPLIEKQIIKDIHYCVCSNGALLWDVKTNKIHVLGKLSKEAYYILKEYALKYELVLNLDTEDFNGTFMPTKNGLQFPSWMSQKQIMDLAIVNPRTLEQIEEVVENPNSNIVQVALRNPLEIAQEVTNNIRKDLQGQASVFLTNSVYTDVNPLGISKYIGIEKVLEKENLTDRNLIAFGDSGNDCEMLSQASIGIAMGNATDEAKNVADMVIGDHQSDTIGKTLFDILKSSN
ncbi:Cof-type HAD-IIB family hydrolase [Mycoplasmopsis columboralis]|uniref:COF family HAD hydrolase protein n=1 Tax=Mycoplasmopsis columboralis TaxID=171282 RepID=A0A449B6Q7_9BACT|nr:Cof-type HAD-IIB family hydrolase [Mycoplasmopsis columboralis]VEU76284.1 COF family HAD hydrolase protein [Mycoplasmopsis columboralis]